MLTVNSETFEFKLFKTHHLVDCGLSRTLEDVRKMSIDQYIGVKEKKAKAAYMTVSCDERCMLLVISMSDFDR